MTWRRACCTHLIREPRSSASTQARGWPGSVGVVEGGDRGGGPDNITMALVRLGAWSRGRPGRRRHPLTPARCGVPWVQTLVPRGEVNTMAQEETSAAVTGQRHAAEHADVERRHVGDHAQVSQRHLAAHEELYARHGSDHTLLASRHAADREKAADATLNQKAALSARHGAQHVVMEIWHAAQLAWMGARHAGERLRMDQRHAAELLAQERRHAREDRQRA